MKKTAALIEKLIKLANGEMLPASTLKGDWFEQMKTDGVLIAITHGSRISFKAANTKMFPNYLDSQFDIRDLAAEHELLLADDVARATQVAVTGDSKFIQRRTFTGFLVNSFMPIEASLSNRHITINPIEGSFLFIADYQNFIIPADVVIVVENAENFHYINRQRNLFHQFEKTLFVSRYPQSADLRNWLMQIPNQYLHFGDFDLAGLRIYETEFYKYLSNRASFFIPEDVETRLQNGSAERYNNQYGKFKSYKPIDKRLLPLYNLIHKYHRGYDQEGYIM